MALELWRPRDVLRNPFRELARMERDMEEMFNRFMPAWRGNGGERGWMPAVDMVDAKDEIIVKADLPGIDEKDVEVTVQDGALTIRGHRKEEREEKKEDYFYAERSYGEFARILPLPSGVDADRVKATFKKGVLEVHLPKTKDAKAKTVEIEAE